MGEEVEGGPEIGSTPIRSPDRNDDPTSVGTKRRKKPAGISLASQVTLKGLQFCAFSPILTCIKADKSVARKPWPSLN